MTGWRLAELAALREVGDEEADAYVAELLSARQPEERGVWLATAIEALRAAQEPTADWVKLYEDSPVTRPSWQDDSLVRYGQQVFDNWLLDIMTTLFCASLPFAYASGRGSAVLAGVSELYDGRLVRKRISLTGRMLLDITDTGSFSTGGKGIRTLRRVRLLHACVRARLMESGSGSAWPVATRGLPINQEDLMATQLAFTTAVFQGLERLGYDMLAVEKAAYLHLWAVTGHYLGIESARALDDLSSAESLSTIMRSTLLSASPQGRQLMRELLVELAATFPPGMRTMPRALVRRCAGDDIADLLAVPVSRWSGPIRVWAAIDKSLSRASLGRLTLRIPSRLVGRTLIRRSIAAGIRDAPAQHSPQRWIDPMTDV